MAIKQPLVPHGHTGPIVTKGKPLTTTKCPRCEGDAVPAKNAQGKDIQKCNRCGAEITSRRM